MGTGLVLNVSIDGKQVAAVPRGQTYSGSISPGQHVISVLLVPNQLNLPPTQKRLSVQAGQTYNFTAMWQGNRVLLMWSSKGWLFQQPRATLRIAAGTL
jgi:hypothetical protein